MTTGKLIQTPALLPAEIYYAMLRFNLPDYLEYAKEVKIKGDTFHKPEITVSRERADGKDSIISEVRFGSEYYWFVIPLAGKSQKLAIDSSIADAVDAILRQSANRIPGLDSDPLGVDGENYSQIDARQMRVEVEQITLKEDYRYKGPDSGYFVYIVDSKPLGIAEVHLQTDDTFKRIAQGVGDENDLDNCSPTGEMWVGEYLERRTDGTFDETLFGYWGYESIEHILCEGDASVDADGLFAISGEEYELLRKNGESEITEEIVLPNTAQSIVSTRYIQLARVEYFAARTPTIVGGCCEYAYSHDGDKFLVYKNVASRKNTPRNADFADFNLDEVAFGIDRQEVTAKAHLRIEANRLASPSVPTAKRKPRSFER